MPSRDHSRSGSISSTRSSSIKSLLTKVTPRSRSGTLSGSYTGTPRTSTSSLHLRTRDSSIVAPIGKSTFAPVREISYEEQREAPNLGDSGWGEKDWSKVKAEQEWLDEQRKEYAKQRKAYDQVQEARTERGEGGIVSGERKWEEQLNRMKILEEKRRRDELQRARMEERERRRQRELELQWALHPPTPKAWPGDSDDEGGF